MLRHLHLAVLIFALSAFTQAVQLPPGFLKARQNTPVVSGGTGVSASVSPSTTAAVTTTQAPATTTTPMSTTPSSVDEPTTTPAATTPTTRAITTTIQPSSSTVAPTTAPTTQETTQTTSANSDTVSSSSVPSTITSNLPASSIDTAPASSITTTSTDLLPVPEVLTTITFTSDGRVVSTTATGTRTTASTSTSTPGLASGYGNQNNTLSEGSKKLIGGIVGGIGGALLLAGIAFVVYKMWGRKKHEKVPSEEEYFGASTDSIAMQKEAKSGWGPSSLTSKFSEPLDRYKNLRNSPGGSAGYKSPGSVNAASNF